MCDETSAGIPGGRIYWDGPRKAKLGPNYKKVQSTVKVDDENALVWDHVSRRDRGIYRQVTKFKNKTIRLPKPVDFFHLIN